MPFGNYTVWEEIRVWSECFANGFGYSYQDNPNTRELLKRYPPPLPTPPPSTPSPESHPTTAFHKISVAFIPAIFFVCFSVVVSFLFFFFFFFLSISLSLAWNSSRLRWVKHSSRKSSATHSCMCAVFLCVQTMVRLPVSDIFNPFTAMFAALSLGKRSIKMPNLKPSIFFSFPVSHEHVKGFLSKCTALKVDLL